MLFLLAIFAVVHVQLIAYGISLGMGLDVLGSMLTNFLKYGVYLQIIPDALLCVVETLTKIRNGDASKKQMAQGVEMHSVPFSLVVICFVLAFLCQMYAVYLNYHLLPPT